MELVLGIDIGGTNTKFGLVNLEGEIIKESSIKTSTSHAIDDFIQELYNSVITLCKAVDDNYTIIGVGVGAPNGNYHTGTIEYAPNLPWKGVIPLKELLIQRFNLPVNITNDANAAAIGEMVYGGARGMKDFIVITLGTGVGSGIVSNRQLIYGHDGFAGEIGHTIVFPYGRMCGCGRKGCLEAYASATGLVRTYKEMYASKADGVSTYIKDIENVDAKMIHMAAQAGELVALDTFNFTGQILGLALSNAVAYTSPEAIFLFGGLANAGELLLKPTIDSFEEHLLKIYKQKIKIIPSKLSESNAAILGAASLMRTI